MNRASRVATLPATIFSLHRVVTGLCISIGVASHVGMAADAPPTLRVGAQASDITTLDPYRTSAQQDLAPISWIFGGLVRFAPGSADPTKIESDLAQTWDVSADKTVWTFHLRHGVLFQRGFGEVTSADVVYSLKRAADPKTSSFAPDYAQFKNIEALDKYTVRITLSAPVPSLLGKVANYHGGMIVSEKAETQLGDKFGQTPVGFGPFAYADHKTQSELVLTAFPQYFRGAPKIAEIDYRFIPSDASRELAFDANELDLMIGKREQKWVDREKKADGVKVDVFAPGELRTLFLNQSIKPLDDIRVRQALAYAVNVPQLVQFIGKDITTPARSPVPPGYVGEQDVGPKYPFDPAKAKKLLAEAGYPNGLTIKSVVSSNNAILPTMQVIQAQLKQSGIDLSMSVVDHTTYQAQIRQDVSPIVFYGAARFPVADSYLTDFYLGSSSIGKPTQVANFSHCSVADAEIVKARNDPDPAEQAALWKSAQEKIQQAICGIPLFDLKQVYVRHGNLDYGYRLEGAMNLAPVITEKTVLSR
jgi:peptide/nickel transport system substrate-binding protein